jgi:hypothetical protein
VHGAAAAFTSHDKYSNYAKPKPFSWPKLANVGFSSSNFTVQITYRAPLGMLLVATKCLRQLPTSIVTTQQPVTITNYLPMIIR